ncbi:MAG: hypothetical protein ABI579_08175 [Candidatus Sumerlaeota bacterium]
MLLKLFLFVILVLACAYALGREVIALGLARRDGENSAPYIDRFRRRGKGLALLIMLYLLAAFFENVYTSLHFQAREVILYIGFTLIVLVWLLILAGRDVRATALQALEQRRRLASDSMAGIDEEIQRFREEHSNEQAPRPPAE